MSTPAEIRDRAPVAFVEHAQAAYVATAHVGALPWEKLSGDGIQWLCEFVREIQARFAERELARLSAIEEVAFWRRDLSARLWLATLHHRGCMVRGEAKLAEHIRIEIRSWLASYDAARNREWHSRCDACGEFVRPGEPSGSGEDASGHLRCLSEDGADVPNGPDTSEAELIIRVDEARTELERSEALAAANPDPGFAEIEPPEACVACGMELVVGVPVYNEKEGGLIHATCAGPERESYVGKDGEPLKEGEPIPAPWAFAVLAPAPLPLMVPCPACLDGYETHGDRHAGTRMDQCTTCGGERMVPAKTGETPEASFNPEAAGV